jgi:predicted Zn-dependent peptidase
MIKRIKLRLLLFLALLAFAFGAPLAAAAPASDFKTEKLPNGLTLIYKVMKDQPQVSINAIFPIGFFEEKHQGMPHLLEHLAFRGGSGYHYDDIVAVTNRQGGFFNGATNFYSTSYNYVVPKEQLDRALKVFNGSLWKTDFSEANVHFERRIIRHELDMDYGFRYPYYAVLRYFYPEMQDDRQKVDFTPSQVREFHMTYYQPENATYVMAGDFDPRAVISQLSQLSNGYGRIATPPAKIDGFRLPRGEIVEQRNIYPYQFQLLMAYEFTGLSAKERMLLNLLAFSYGADYKTDYERNQFKEYNVVSRSIAGSDYFGIYYLERTRPYSAEALAAEKANLRQYVRQFRKMDFKQRLQDFCNAIVMEQTQSRESAVDAAALACQRLMDPSSITADDLALIKKLSVKDLERFIDSYLSKPPTTWVLVKTTQ